MRWTVIVRWLLAAGCVVFSIRHMALALKMNDYSAAGFLIFSIGAFIAAVLLIAPETITKVLEFCSRIFTGAVLPDDKNRKPPLSYLLARRYARQLRYDDAIAEYQKMIRYYPDVEQSYHELIVVTFVYGDQRLGQKAVRLYEKKFGKKYVPEKFEVPES